MLQGKKVLLGVCGSIAAYKAALLVRLLVKAEAEVQVILTTSASEFITPLTLATLSKRPVLTHFVRDEGGLWNNHVELGLWADALVIAPASANTVGKMANGFCDNLLAAGGKIYVDCDLVAGHITRTTIHPGMLKSALDARDSRRRAACGVL